MRKAATNATLNATESNGTVPKVVYRAPATAPPTGRVWVNTTLKEYPDDLMIEHYTNLACGACIRGGYTFCV